MNTHLQHVKRYTGRRTWLALIGLVGIGYLSGCKAQDHVPPKPPYGQALDVTQANSFVEFDFRIDKADRYDVVLEIFKKNLKERIPDEVWDVPNAHFKVRLQSLAPTGDVILEQEVRKTKEPNGLFNRSYVGPSRTEKANLMGFTKYLVYEYPLDQGLYRIRCDNLNPILTLEDRLVKVTIEPKIYRK